MTTFMKYQLRKNNEVRIETLSIGSKFFFASVVKSNNEPPVFVITDEDTFVNLYNGVQWKLSSYDGLDNSGEMVYLVDVEIQVAFPSELTV